MSIKKFNPKARADEIAARLKAAEEAKAAYDATIDEALEKAGRTRAEFVEVLYEHFGIEPEATERTNKDGQPVLSKDGGPILVKTDKNETKRIAKLGEAFEKLVENAEAVKSSGAHAQQSDGAPSGSAKPGIGSADQSAQKTS